MSASRNNPAFDASQRSAPPFLCLLVLTWLMATWAAPAVCAQVNPQRTKDEIAPRSESRSQSIVHGRVIYDDTRRPLRRVEVSIYDPAHRGRSLMAWTDARGEFQIKDVPAGRYFVQVQAPGVMRPGSLDGEEGQEEVTTVTVDGASKSEVTVRVKRGGAVSGKVTYADGDPAMNASIRIWRKKGSRWIPIYLGGRASDREATDERGIYRVAGLSPGEYLVGAAEEKMGIELTAQDDPEGGNLLNRTPISTTYYDGATSLGNATPVQVAAGDEKTDINITLADLALHTISGVVTLKPGNRPVARARISLKRKTDEPAYTYSTEDPVVNTDDQGRFVFDEVQEGSYTMSVTPPRAFPTRYSDGQTVAQANADQSQKFASRHLELNVAGDLANMSIEVSSGSRISGVMTVDGGKPFPRGATVILEPASGERLDQLSAQTQPDGTFTLEGVTPGAYYLRTALQPDKPFYTKSVMQGRLDLTRDPLTVKEGEDISDVRMVISPDVAQLSGRVLAADGKSPARGVSILFVSTDPIEQKTVSRRMYAFTNADGLFRVSGAPGDYLAIVMRSSEEIYQLRGEALRERAVGAQRITLQPGENSKLELVMPGNK